MTLLEILHLYGYVFFFKKHYDNCKSGFVYNYKTDVILINQHYRIVLKKDDFPPNSYCTLHINGEYNIKNILTCA